MRRYLTWSLAAALIAVVSSARAAVEQISVKTDGVFCLSCAYRLEKAVRRLDGVDTAAVQMKPTRVEITLRDGVWMDADRLRSTIKSAGFKPGAVTLTVIGSMIRWRDQPALRLSGSDRVLLLLADPRSPAVYERALKIAANAPDRPMEIEGDLNDHPNVADKAAPAILHVRRATMKQ